MPQTLTRRQFLRSAGGITFLALHPVGRGLFAATDTPAPVALPLFTALPYLQPGPEGRLVADQETVRLAWQTEPKAADFTVDFGPDETYGRTAAIAKTQRDYTKNGVAAGRYNYVCALDRLALGAVYHYRVRGNGQDIVKGYFTTRQPRGKAVRFAAFGDNSAGLPADHAIAYQVYQAHPDFIMNAGDNCYDHGWDDEYSKNFFPVYNADRAGADVGAPLLRSVPFYTVMANHDLNVTEPGTKIPCANFDANPDSLAYYTNFYLPLNGPAKTNYPTVVYGDAARLSDFKASAGDRFPRMANYSFDYGDVHFLCLDANTYVDATDPDLQAWAAADLAATDAPWKIAVYHQPAFNMSYKHYAEQQMRPLAPLLEKGGVDLVLSGHEHNYQRTLPLRFAPTNLEAAHAVSSTNRLIPGDFTRDTKFDGVMRTKPDGVIYITTGAGGNNLYNDGNPGDHPETWLHPQDGNVAVCMKLVSDIHSFSLIEVAGAELSLRQVDENGKEIDRIRVTKA